MIRENTEQYPLPTITSGGWRAGLELKLDCQLGRTRLQHARHWGPLRVQRPFYPAGPQGECHLYVLHPPGGMVTGDVIEIEISLANGAHVLATTPSAGKIYRGDGGVVPQSQTVRCNVSGGSCLEWLPQETIIFDGARGQNRVRVDMDESGRCAVWDIVCLGRPASDETFEAGYLRQGMEIYRADQPVYLENNLFSGGGELLQAPWGLRGCPVAGTFVITLAIEEQQLSELRNRIVATENEWFALSDLDGLLVARYLGHSTAQCRKLFTELWRALRPDLVGVSACEPRIWHT